MADFGQPVAQNVNPGNGLQTLSQLLQLLQLKQQQQNLQTGQYQQQSAQGNAQQAQQSMQERLAIQKMMSSGIDDQGNSIKDQSGNPDPAKVLPALGRIAPLTGQQYAQMILKTHSDNVGLQASSASLDAQERGMLMAPVQAAALDPSVKAADVNAGIDNLVSAHPEMANAATYLKGLVGHLDNVPPGKRTVVAQQIAARMQPGQSVQTQPTGGSVNTGAAQIQGTVAPAVAGGGFTPATQVQNQVPPGAQLIEDAYHRQFVFDPKTNTVTPVGMGRGGAPATVPGRAGAAPGGFQQPVAGQQQVLDSVENARAIGDQAPGTRNVNQHLLQLSKSTSTGGWGTQTAQQMAATIGMPSGSRFQEIGAYLDRQAAMQARTMGVPNTNAGLAASERATGTTDYTPQALQEKVKFADALNSAGMAYRVGLDKVIGTGPAPNLNNYQAYRAAWAQNFDPDVFRAEDAQRRGDTADLAALKSRLGPNGMRRLAIKSANLDKLEAGQIP